MTWEVHCEPDLDTPKEVSALDAEDLPVARGAYIAVDQKPSGRSVERSLEWFKSEGFEIVEWDGRWANSINARWASY